MAKNNASAVELWAQVFSSLSKSEYASIVDPNYDPTEDEAKAREEFKRAGWSDDEVELRMQSTRDEAAGASVTSPGASPIAEVFLQRLCTDIETALERLNIQSHRNVARGIDPRTGPYASKINVIMTDESIITVGAHTFRFCGLIARAFVRTLHLNIRFWESDACNPESAMLLLRRAYPVMQYWRNIYESYVLTGTNILVPFRPAMRHELLIFEQVARAMELFALAHEYGHHHLQHGRQVESEPIQEELEADQFALKVCYEIERVPLIFSNPYLSSGAGGVILLSALDMLREVERVITGQVQACSSTHPDTASRIESFRSVALLKPTEFAALRAFRVASCRVMEAVRSELSAQFKVIPRVMLDRLAGMKVEGDVIKRIE